MLLPKWGCKSRYSVPRRSEISTWLLLPLRASTRRIVRGPRQIDATRAVQLAVLTTRNRIPSAYWNRDIVVAAAARATAPTSRQCFVKLVSIQAASSKGRTPPTFGPAIDQIRVRHEPKDGAGVLDIEVPSGLLAIVDDVIE